MCGCVCRCRCVQVWVAGSMQVRLGVVGCVCGRVYVVMQCVQSLVSMALYDRHSDLPCRRGAWGQVLPLGCMASTTMSTKGPYACMEIESKAARRYTIVKILDAPNASTPDDARAPSTGSGTQWYTVARSFTQ